MQKLFTAVLLMAGLNATAQQNKSAVQFSKTITAADLKKKLTVIASAEMEGRETASAGQRKAAAYIESHFKKLGLTPGAAGSYQQTYPVYIDTLDKAVFTINGKPFTYGADFSIALSQVSDTTASFKEIVLAGYGVTDSIYDDYKDLDVKGKCVLIAEGEPKLENGNYLLTGTNRHSRSASLYTKQANARKHGAAIVLFYQQFAPATAAVVRKGGMYVKPRGAAPRGLNTITIGRTILEAISEGFSKDLDGMIEAGNSLSTTLSTDIRIDLGKQVATLQSSNVIGILPGTDKKDEYVFITGHYDHLGKRGDSIIYYGADDDGTGTAAVIQMAQAFTAAKAKGKGPRRSIVFMTVSGEEKGLWGSDYYVEHPTVDLTKVSADLNIDMIGRIDPSYKGDSTNYLYVIGDDKISSNLTPITDSINKQYLHMELDRKFNDPKDPNRIFYRSDHYNFAKKGIPIIFYFSGLHPDYHRPTDTVDKIRFDLMQQRAKLVFFTAWDIANRDTPLKRDIPLN
jgi:hypothetical protein